MTAVVMNWSKLLHNKYSRESGSSVAFDTCWGSHCHHTVAVTWAHGETIRYPLIGQGLQHTAQHLQEAAETPEREYKKASQFIA